MKNIFSIYVFFILFSFASQAQLTIDECHTRAKENYPQIRQYELIERSKEYTLSNVIKGYLPQFQVSARATFQSEVTSIPVSIPNVDIPEIPKTQYQLSTEVSQILWDGGVISSQKKLIAANAEVEKQQLQVDLYAIKARVNQLFFGILLLDTHLAQNKILQDELVRNHSKIVSYIENGIANQTDLDVVKVEQINAKQIMLQLQSTRRAYADMLSYMIGAKLDTDIKLLKPDINNQPFSSSINRYELQWFESQNNIFNLQKKILKTAYMPKFNLFMQGGVGCPALNMFSRNFDAYYIGGIRLSWNFGALYTRKNDLQKIDVNRHLLDIKRETFIYNLQLEITRENQDIKRLREQMQYDDEIIALRKNIKQASEAKFANGTITITDLMSELTRENIAQQTKASHEIELLIAIYNLKYTTND
ncbi:MAG: TolC family protein [Prevotellaceae bacterium]|jgi:outer membrane protein TolC|nr:TolC family protein [Prevotellaceae bacterium]